MNLIAKKRSLAQMRQVNQALLLSLRKKKPSQDTGKNDVIDSVIEKPYTDVTSQSSPTNITEKKILLEIPVKLM